jgi:hypothetical protein
MIALHFFADISCQMQKVYHQSALQIREALLGKGGLDMMPERGILARDLQSLQRLTYDGNILVLNEHLVVLNSS